MIKVLFVCTGNICRSPLAEGVLRRMAEAAGLGAHLEADSAGTHDYHAGSRPDARAIRTAAKRGIDLSHQRARRVKADDFKRFDYIVALDRGHKHHLARAFDEGAGAEIRLLLEFAPDAHSLDIPDPYGGNDDDFERACDLIEAGAAGLLAEIRARHFPP